MPPRRMFSTSRLANRVPAVSQETENGVLVREDLETGELVGMTVLDFMKRWPGPNLVLP